MTDHFARVDTWRRTPPMNRRIDRVDERRTPRDVPTHDGTRKAQVCVIVGTRPEVIKMAPVIRELERHQDRAETTIVTTAQHREMLSQALDAFGLVPHVDLGLMSTRQVLADFTSRALLALSSCFSEIRPDVVLVQGDTTTVLSAALAAYYLNIPVAHVEAGLRSGNLHNPFPEELNRRMAGVIADLHFAPTATARRNLLAEGVPESRILVTGNTIVDALHRMPHRARFDEPLLNALPWDGTPTVLATVHRRENLGDPLHRICAAFRALVERHHALRIVFPVHLNPRVREVVAAELGGVARIHCINPLSYGDLLEVLRRSLFALTDSGGIQEECPSLQKPVLVLRDNTERPEVIEAGFGALVGTQPEAIVEAGLALLNEPGRLQRMASGVNPFGDGAAAERIVAAVLERFAPARSVSRGGAQAGNGA